MKTLAFFNNKGGVGKTTTVYHIAWMLAEFGCKVLAVDLDPQSNLSSMFLSQARMEEIVLNPDSKATILDAIEPVTEGEPYVPVHLEKISEHISLLIGNLSLSAFEDKLSDAWTKCLSGDPFAFKVTSVFKTLFNDAAQRCNADWVLVDVGPNLGAMNRTILVSTDFIAMPVASDLFSLQGIINIGKTLKEWRIQWDKRKGEFRRLDLSTIPSGGMQPIGYVLMQYTAKDSRPVKSYMRWADRIPDVYYEFVLGQMPQSHIEVNNDLNCLALLKHFHSLAPMSMEAHKPIFLLKPADGAIGAHMQAVKRSYSDFKNLALKIIAACNAEVPC